MTIHFLAVLIPRLRFDKPPKQFYSYAPTNPTNLRAE